MIIIEEYIFSPDDTPELKRAKLIATLENLKIQYKKYPDLILMPVESKFIVREVIMNIGSITTNIIYNLASRVIIFLYNNEVISSSMQKVV